MTNQSSIDELVSVEASSFSSSDFFAYVRSEAKKNPDSFSKILAFPNFLSDTFPDVRVWEAFRVDLGVAYEFGRKCRSVSDVSARLEALNNCIDKRFWNIVGEKYPDCGLLEDGRPKADYLLRFYADLRREFERGVADAHKPKHDVLKPALVSLGVLVGGVLAYFGVDSYVSRTIDDVEKRLESVERNLDYKFEQVYVPRLRAEIVNCLNSSQVQEGLKSAIVSGVDEYIKSNPNTFYNETQMRDLLLRAVRDPAVQAELRKHLSVNLFK